MRLWELKTKVTISAAHNLRDYEGKCKNCHGHNWNVAVVIKSKAVNEKGFVMDFGDVKKLLMKYDHQNINGVPPFDEMNPTAENMAKVMADDVAKAFFDLQGFPPLEVEVTVEETENNEVKYVWTH